MNMTNLLLSNDLLTIQTQRWNIGEPMPKVHVIGTFFSNLASYGYVLDKTATAIVTELSLRDLANLWKKLEPELKAVTGANRNMADFVVYKNFPAEVMEMSKGQYWFNQILMYWGFDNGNFTQEIEDRDPLIENLSLKVLKTANANSLQDIWENLINNASRWSDNQTEQALFLVEHWSANNYVLNINLDKFSFKENGITCIHHGISNNLSINYQMSNATDVLRLCAKLSGGDIANGKPVKFINFKRPLRRHLLALLDASNNLADDIAMRPELWKKLLAKLHPGDYPNHVKVQIAYDALYKGLLKSFDSKVENAAGKVGLELLKTRPGAFVRQFHKMYALHGKVAAKEFSAVIPELTNSHLVKFKKYLLTINDRKQLIYPPKGNWNKAQFAENTKVKIDKVTLRALLFIVGNELNKRLGLLFPEGVALGEGLDKIKLQTNDQKLAEYGRGTSFKIPDEVTFIRTASYWELARSGNVWYDNGWNFFGENWKELGSVCWNRETFGNNGKKAAVFSGDPTNSKDLKGRACQMIDLYIDKLIESGVRYAVWNVLAYSNISFADANDVLATLQWGEKPQAGKLYEPARAQMVFPLKGDNLTKYVAYIDLKTRELIYMDINLKGATNSASLNSSKLKETMPAVVEYLNSLPSVHDLMVHASEGTVPFVYSDEGLDINNGSAYVFKALNPDNVFSKISLSSILD